MKTKTFIAIIIFLFLFFPLKANASSADAYHVSGADKLENGEYITEDEKSGKTNIDVTKKLLNIISAGLYSGIKGALKALGVIAGLLTVSSILKNFSYI